MNETIIRMRGLTKRYGKKTAVDGLSLDIRKGEIFGLLGPNGAGKTTTTMMLTGLTEPSEGTAEICGLDCVRQSMEVRRVVGYLPDNLGFYNDLTGRENLRFTAELNDLSHEETEELIDRLLLRTGLSEAGDQRVGTYSSGMRQRLGIADVLIKDPQVIIMTAADDKDANSLQDKTGIPVVVVPGSDTTLDDNAYETIRIMGEVYGKEERAEELTAYLDSVKEDLEARTASIPDADKPTVYVGGVSFKGHHGFEGTEAGYGPFVLIHANNLADSTGQTGAFDIDTEQVLAWDPDVIFLDFNGMALINEDYAKDPDYYQGLTAVREGRVYSQISFRSSASNLETALADAYYAATVLYPEEFADVDPVEKAGEIFTSLLGANPYEDLKEAGYEFRPIQIGE